MDELHQFHIPVLGLGYSIDTPIKVARFGISSVISIMDDELLEQMRKHHSPKRGITFLPITKKDQDFRAKRITAYLNLVNDIIENQVAELKRLPFGGDNDLDKYFEMAPEWSPVKAPYRQMLQLELGEFKAALEQELRDALVPGSIDVNIMAKVDRLGDDAPGPEYSEALSALRGFARSNLRSAVVFSAGYNPRLYNYLENFSDFFPDGQGRFNKKIILKVSDFRSALTQGKILAKKGLWVSEFRIESGLNCGGHAFATDGLLLGPILEEFKNKRNSLHAEMYALCQDALARKALITFNEPPQLKITVQGGIGTSDERDYLVKSYLVDGTGWGSPFLLVPEATNVDTDTLEHLATATPDDYYLSDASPLGVPFNNFRKASSQKQLADRVKKQRPGSPCYKKYLASNTEFTDTPICTASRQYQNLKIKELVSKELPQETFNIEFKKITEKDCLCEGLGAPALLSNGMSAFHKLSAVTICPGPNLAYFSGVFSLPEMVSHIYGRLNILNTVPRPNMFMKELQLYISYFKTELLKTPINTKTGRYLQTFKSNLLEGIQYYESIITDLGKGLRLKESSIRSDLHEAVKVLSDLKIPSIG